MSSNFWLLEWFDFLFGRLDAAALLIKCFTRLLFLTLLVPSLTDSADDDDDDDEETTVSYSDESPLFEFSSDEFWFEESDEDRPLDDEDLADDWEDERSVFSMVPRGFILLCIDFLDVEGTVSAVDRFCLVY